MRVFIRHRPPDDSHQGFSLLLEDEDPRADLGFSEPELANWIPNHHIPREGEQVVNDVTERAFQVLTVEYHYGETPANDYVFLFCIEFPKQLPPLSEG